MAKLVNSMKKKLPKSHNSRMDQQELELLQRYLCFEAFNRAAESTGFYKNLQEGGYFQKRKETDKEEAVGEFHKFLKAHTQNEKFLQTLKMSVAVVSESDDNETRHQRQQHETLFLEWTRLTERESYSTGQSQRKRNNSRRKKTKNNDRRFEPLQQEENRQCEKPNSKDTELYDQNQGIPSNREHELQDRPNSYISYPITRSMDSLDILNSDDIAVYKGVSYASVPESLHNSGQGPLNHIPHWPRRSRSYSHHSFSCRKRPMSEAEQQNMQSRRNTVPTQHYRTQTQSPSVVVNVHSLGHTASANAVPTSNRHQSQSHDRLTPTGASRELITGNEQIDMNSYRRNESEQDVPSEMFVESGNNTTTEIKELREEMMELKKQTQKILQLHLADHDDHSGPSGVTEEEDRLCRETSEYHRTVEKRQDNLETKGFSANQMLQKSVVQGFNNTVKALECQLKCMEKQTRVESLTKLLQLVTAELQQTQ